MGSIRRALVCHPQMPVSPVESITVDVERCAVDVLRLRYQVAVMPDRLALPAPSQPLRSDKLWMTTCFELFVRVAGQSDYAEYNFSPSGQWAAYRFDRYRESRRQLTVDQTGYVALDASNTHFALEAVAELPIAWRAGFLEIGLAAVIEETDGAKSYWALAHPPGQADFHHPDCFALTLAPPEQP